MLTDAAVKKAEPREKPYKMSDSGGLFLYVAPTGLKSWRMKFQLHGKEKLLTFGPYPDVKLSEARERRDAARRKLRDQEDPSGVRRRAETAKAEEAAARALLVTFEQQARAWHALLAPRWAPIHASDVITSLERDVFPDIGHLTLLEIEPATVLATLRKVEARGAVETARRLRQRISAVFAHAVSEGLAKSDPAAIVSKALKPLPSKGRQPALVVLDELQGILRAAEGSAASPITKVASRLLALTAVRPAVVRGATWEEFEGIDWEDVRPGPMLPVWRIPASRMKLVLSRKDEAAFEHVVALPWQAVELLMVIRRLTGRSQLVFPSQRHSHRPLSSNAIGYLYNRVGYHGRHVPHGWRAAFSTVMNERNRADRAVIDQMLAHIPKDKVEAAYNRSQHMIRRRELAQQWANLLTSGLPSAASLLEGPRR